MSFSHFCESFEFILELACHSVGIKEADKCNRAPSFIKGQIFARMPRGSILTLFCQSQVLPIELLLFEPNMQT